MDTIKQIISSPQILGQAIKAARKNANMTQGQLAKKTGLRQGTISDVETGTQKIRIDTLFLILSALDLDIHLIPKQVKQTTEW